MNRAGTAARLASLAAVATLACHPPVTQLVVVVDTTLAPGAIDEIAIFVQAPGDLDASQMAPVRDVTIAPGSDPFPMTLTLVPAGVVTGALTVRVVARLHGARVVARESRLPFQANHSLMLSMLLRAQCQGIECDGNDTCGEAGCHAPEVTTPAAFPGCSPWTSACGDDAAACTTDLRVDPLNCNACGNACSNDAGCTAGYCANAAAREIATGDGHACAVLESGAVACWGRNASGQLGGTRDNNSGHAVVVPGFAHSVVHVAAGANHTCALGSTGGVWCWGDNLHGQLGDGTQAMHTTPQRVTTLPVHVTRIAAGGDQTCALASNDAMTPPALYCWGNNSRGQMQLVTMTHPVVRQPTVMNTGGAAATDVAVGDEHICVIGADGILRCWGDNASGQLGVAPMTPPNSLTPIVAAGLPMASPTALTAGTHFTCAVVAGEVLCWGTNAQRQLGAPFDASQPTRLYNAGQVQAVSAGATHTCALLVDQSVQCWGSNDTYQLGAGSHAMMAFATPAPIAYQPVANDLVQVASGGSFACALRAYGGVVCWGADDSGELGDNGTTNRAHPTIVLGLP